MALIGLSKESKKTLREEMALALRPSRVWEISEAALTGPDEVEDDERAWTARILDSSSMMAGIQASPGPVSLMVVTSSGGRMISEMREQRGDAIDC